MPVFAAVETQSKKIRHPWKPDMPVKPIVMELRRRPEGQGDRARDLPAPGHRQENLWIARMDVRPVHPIPGRAACTKEQGAGLPADHRHPFGDFGLCRGAAATQGLRMKSRQDMGAGQPAGSLPKGHAREQTIGNGGRRLFQPRVSSLAMAS